MAITCLLVVFVKESPMQKIAKKLFKEHKITLSTGFDFKSSDLYVYLKALYEKEPVYMDYGLFKVVEEDGQLVISEHIFYDYQPQKKAKCYIGFKELPKHNNIIENTPFGFELSQKGYSIFKTTENEQNVLSNYQNVSYRKTPIEQGLNEPEATFKFNDIIWGNKEPKKNSTEGAVFSGLKEMIVSKSSFSSFLQSLNIFDANLLRWKKGRSMDAHNGVDYRSFLNLITYFTEGCPDTREVTLGEYDWYDTTFQSILSKNYDQLMNIQNEKIIIERHKVNTESAILINVFNPKFYHQVGEYKFDQPLYVCTANMSFKEITNDINFFW